MVYLLCDNKGRINGHLPIKKPRRTLPTLIPLSALWSLISRILRWNPKSAIIDLVALWMQPMLSYCEIKMPSSVQWCIIFMSNMMTDMAEYFWLIKADDPLRSGKFSETMWSEGEVSLVNRLFFLRSSCHTVTESKNIASLCHLVLCVEVNRSSAWDDVVGRKSSHKARHTELFIWEEAKRLHWLVVRHFNWT